MVFAAGVLAGLVAGVAAGMLVQRRAGGSNLAQTRGFATAIAMVALIVAAIALARSDRSSARSATPPPVATTTPTTSSSAVADGTTTTAIGSTEPSGVVSVPNVEHLSRSEAIPILQHAGLKVSIETLALSNVPANFVISQTPLPGAMTTPGTTVTLVISATA